MTVITAREIEMMNAHTLADVLSSVVGVQLELSPSPGFPPPVHIQGSESRQVRVVLDGVTLNNLSDNFADLGVDYIAFYSRRYETIYISVDDAHIGVLAHEISHAIMDHYFGVPPPAKINEVLGQFVEIHLED